MISCELKLATSAAEQVYAPVSEISELVVSQGSGVVCSTHPPPAAKSEISHSHERVEEVQVHADGNNGCQEGEDASMKSKSCNYYSLEHVIGVHGFNKPCIPIGVWSLIRDDPFSSGCSCRQPLGSTARCPACCIAGAYNLLSTSYC